MQDLISTMETVNEKKAGCPFCGTHFSHRMYSVWLVQTSDSRHFRIVAYPPFEEQLQQIAIAKPETQIMSPVCC
jgi:hypothetical protein